MRGPDKYWLKKYGSPYQLCLPRNVQKKNKATPSVDNILQLCTTSSVPTQRSMGGLLWGMWNGWDVEWMGFHGGFLRISGMIQNLLKSFTLPIRVDSNEGFCCYTNYEQPTTGEIAAVRTSCDCGIRFDAMTGCHGMIQVYWNLSN